MGVMPDRQTTVETLLRVDPQFRALVDEFYPGATPDELAYEVFGKGNPDPADMHVPGSSTKKKVLEGIGIAATAAGVGLGIKDIPETASAVKDAYAGGVRGAALGRKVARASVAPAMLAGDAVAEQQQIAASRRKVAVPTGVSKGVLSDLTNTFIDSGLKTVRNLRAGAKGAEPVTDVVRPLASGQPEARPEKPLVSGTKPYQAGKFLATPTGKKTAVGGTAATLLYGHHERNVGANQAYAAQYGKRDVVDAVWSAQISKADLTKRQVFGYASVVQKNGLAVTDRQGDIITPDDMEDAAYDFVLNSRVGGNMHKRDAFDRPHHVSDLIESFAVTPEKLEGLGIPSAIAKSVPVGWWVGFKVWDDDAWQDVVDGRLQGFSIHGRGVRAPVADEMAWA